MSARCQYQGIGPMCGVHGEDERVGHLRDLQFVAGVGGRSHVPMHHGNMHSPMWREL